MCVGESKLKSSGGGLRFFGLHGLGPCVDQTTSQANYRAHFAQKIERRFEDNGSSYRQRDLIERAHLLVCVCVCVCTCVTIRR